jgi:hypothetical protein
MRKPGLEFTVVISDRQFKPHRHPVFSTSSMQVFIGETKAAPANFNPVDEHRCNR